MRVCNATCTNCGELFSYEKPGSGRLRKFCSKRCSSADSRARLRLHGDDCTVDGCVRKVTAKGLCHSHYNQTYYPNRHPKITVACDSCGLEIEKDQSSKRWSRSYCSYECRTWGVHGVGATCKIPADHWARMYGATCEWTPPRVARAYQCEWCGTGAESMRDDAKYCTRKCKLAHSKVKRRGRERGAIGDYTWMDITRLWVLFDKACAYCATPTALSDIQAEHVVALSNGGANNTSNLLPSCAACNSDKRDLTLHEWRRDRKRRGLAPVTTEWDSADPRYKHLAASGRLAVA